MLELPWPHDHIYNIICHIYNFVGDVMERSQDEITFILKYLYFKKA